MRKNILKFTIVLIFILLFLSCVDKRSKYNGVWYIKKANDIQNLLEMGLDIEFDVNTEGSFFEIYTIVKGVNGSRTLQNTGNLIWISSNGGYFKTSLPDLQNGGEIKGTIKLKGQNLYYSTSFNHEWIFEKK